MFVCIWYDSFLAKAKARGKAWASREEYRRLPLVCVGGPLNATSQLWLVRSTYSSLLLPRLAHLTSTERAYLELTLGKNRLGPPAPMSTGSSPCSLGSSSGSASI